jgi:hypothetical protein
MQLGVVCVTRLGGGRQVRVKIFSNSKLLSIVNLTL